MTKPSYRKVSLSKLALVEVNEDFFIAKIKES